MVRPGITGLWQTSGRNNTSYGERLCLCRYYVRNWSVWLDVFDLGAYRQDRLVVRRRVLKHDVTRARCQKHESVVDWDQFSVLKGIVKVWRLSLRIKRKTAALSMIGTSYASRASTESPSIFRWHPHPAKPLRPSTQELERIYRFNTCADGDQRSTTLLAHMQFAAETKMHTEESRHKS